jgi:hypothetical protein
MSASSAWTRVAPYILRLAAWIIRIVAVSPASAIGRADAGRGRQAEEPLLDTRSKRYSRASSSHFIDGAFKLGHDLGALPHM